MPSAGSGLVPGGKSGLTLPGVTAGRSGGEAVRGLPRSRSANATADNRNSAPVTASQCHTYGSADSMVEA